MTFPSISFPSITFTAKLELDCCSNRTKASLQIVIAFSILPNFLNKFCENVLFYLISCIIFFTKLTSTCWSVKISGMFRIRRVVVSPCSFDVVQSTGSSWRSVITTWNCLFPRNCWKIKMNWISSLLTRMILTSFTAL